jgi:membrane protein
MLQGLRSLARATLRAVAFNAAMAWRRLVQAFPVVGRVGQFIWEVLRKYHRDDCWTYAASISFFLTISLVPLATLFFKVLALYTYRGAVYSERFRHALFEMYPQMPVDFVDETLRHSKKVSGWGFGAIILLIGAHWGVNQLDRTFSHIFDLRVKPHRQTRSYHLLRRLAIVVGGLLFLVILMTVGVEWTLRRGAPFSPLLMYTYLPPLVALFVVTMVLQHLPRRHVRFRHAFLGALVSTGLWVLAKGTFAWYLDHTPTWGILYGGLGSAMAALIFLYYSCALFMLGAEVTAAFYRHETGAIRMPAWTKGREGGT